MTKQEMFDKVWNGLKNQGWEMSFANGICAYRGTEGRRCAVGHLMPDEKYDPSMEGESVRLLLEGNSLLLGESLGSGEVSFLARLQGIHDGSESPEEMERSLRNCAENLNLIIPENPT